MAKNRKNQAAAIRFGPALKALFLCMVIAGSAVGYVWQKGQIYLLGQEIRQNESHLAQLRNENQRLDDQLAILRSPIMLDERARALNLELVPAQPQQVWRLPEPSGMLDKNAENNDSRQFAARQTVETTQ
jgi:cell division protein FtsB